MDLVAAYAARYGGVPRDEQPWHEVMGLAERIGGIEARQLLLTADGMALSRPVPDGYAGIRAIEVSKLERMAKFGKG